MHLARMMQLRLNLVNLTLSLVSSFYKIGIFIKYNGYNLTALQELSVLIIKPRYSISPIDSVKLDEK